MPDYSRQPERCANITARDIIAAVAQVTGVPIKSLIGRARLRGVVRPRQVAMYLAIKLGPSYSLPNIGKAFGRDHTTVISTRKAIEAAMMAGEDWPHDIIDPVKALLASGFRAPQGADYKPAKRSATEVYGANTSTPLTPLERRQHEALMAVGIGPIKAVQAVVALRGVA